MKLTTFEVLVTIVVAVAIFAIATNVMLVRELSRVDELRVNFELLQLQLQKVAGEIYALQQIGVEITVYGKIGDVK